ncbi:hypothetical protein AA313_de0201908 [Arthrobotrys entomopaga]|nr:hypothetical protein AA313_de0201908 [Arthrobotrys entomopaga]
MTRPNHRAYNSDPRSRNELDIPVNSKLYSFCSRMKQTPVRSMLMAHGCCFDFFEKGYCKAGNDCKYSHLNPGDERNLVMDSEQGLRRKKYYRPATLETYLPGSQDVICFTFARKGWCIHGDKCWNQHISPPTEIVGDVPPSFNGLTISSTPSPVLDDMPTIDLGYALTQPYSINQAQTPSPVIPVQVPHQAPRWSSTTLGSVQAGTSQAPRGFNAPTVAHKQTRSAPQGKYFYHPDPNRAAASANWRATVKPDIQTPAPPVEEAPQPVRSALQFNWRPVISDSTSGGHWKKISSPTTPTMALGNPISCRPTRPALQIPADSLFQTGTFNTPVEYTYDLDLVNYADELHYAHHHQHQHDYRLGLDRCQSGIPYLH